MNFLLEIAIDYFGWILGKKFQNELSKGNKRKGYMLFTGFLASVAIIGIYSMVWVILFI